MRLHTEICKTPGDAEQLHPKWVWFDKLIVQRELRQTEYKNSQELAQDLKILMLHFPKQLYLWYTTQYIIALIMSGKCYRKIVNITFCSIFGLPIEGCGVPAWSLVAAQFHIRWLSHCLKEIYQKLNEILIMVMPVGVSLKFSWSAEKNLLCIKLHGLCLDKVTKLEVCILA